MSRFNSSDSGVLLGNVRAMLHRINFGISGFRLAMALLIFLRVVATFPVVATPHQHGEATHTHGAGGLFHTHDGERPHSHRATRHGVYLVVSSDGVPSENTFPIRLAVRHPANHNRDSVPPEPSTPEKSPEKHHDSYFSAASALAHVALPPDLPHHAKPGEPRIPDARAIFDGPRYRPEQARGPPRFPSFIRL